MKWRPWLGLLLFVSFYSVPLTANEFCKGMTWRVLSQVGELVRVGKDDLTNPYRGDSATSQALPILAIKKSELHSPAFSTRESIAQAIRENEPRFD